MLFWKKNSKCGLPTLIQENNLIEEFCAVFNKRQFAEIRKNQNKSVQNMRNSKVKLIKGTTVTYDAL